MIDSHCHLDHDPLYINLTEVISRSKNSGVDRGYGMCGGSMYNAKTFLSIYDDVIEERIEVLELYRDLERMKQMELVVQKSLGSYLAESDSVDDESNNSTEANDSIPLDDDNEVPGFGFMTVSISLLAISFFRRRK